MVGPPTAGPKRRTRKRDLRREETALWEEFIRAITPLARRARAAKPTPETPALDRAAPPAAPVPVPAPVPPRPARSQPAVPPLAPLGRRLKQQIARGAHTIDARLDLHGMTQAKAHAALARFLRSVQADGGKLVLVITGKGGRPGWADDAEADRGVLRRQVPRWLAEPGFRAYVVGFEPAHIGHGGEGALYIRLRRPRP